MTINIPEQLVVNWHLLEKCNFGCGYCFAHWSSPSDGKGEIWRCPQRCWEKLLDELLQLHHHAPGNWGKTIRLNFAGGEPMLLWKQGRGPLNAIMEYAHSLGFALSIISNGYLMDDEFIRTWAPKMQIIGISVDAADVGINVQIGRCSKGKPKQQISTARVAEIFRMARQCNPDIECKINTVVNAKNWQADLRPILEAAKPDRWKVFKMLPVADADRPEIADQQASFKITDEQYRFFLDRYSDYRHITMPENNDEMTESYWMVDPWGRLYQNKRNENDDNYHHVHSTPVHEIGIEKACQIVTCDPDKFVARYRQPALTP